LRHWWSLHTIHTTEERKFASKEVVLTQPNNCPSIEHEGLLRSFGISSCCKRGSKEKPNHDAFAVCRFDDSYVWGPLTLYCVLDGHGDNGHVISELCADMIPKLLFEAFRKLAPKIPSEGLGYVRTPEELEHVRCAVEEVFVSLQKMLEQLTIQGKICARKSGATTTLVVQGVERDLQGNEDPWLLIGHVGDTRACLIRSTVNDDAMRQGRDSSESPEVLELTRDHRPDNAREEQRINQAGARVEAFRVEHGTVRPLDPRVVSTGQTWPALNMSRTIGDLFAQTQGVIELPEVRIKDVQFGDKVIICTDGVWDVITPSDAQAIIQETQTRNPSGATNAAEVLVSEARKAWVCKTEDFYDDITALVIDIQSFT